MRPIVNIAKNELRYLFYSPIAWFILIVFFVECAVFFSTPLCDTANWQDILIKNSPQFKGFENPLTFGIFIKKGLFENVIGNLYLFIPVLTMGLINREVNTGSFKLLYSSPVTIRQVVLGKFLGIMCYNLLLIAIVGIFMLTGLVTIRHADYGLLFSACLGFYLIVCAYSSIGLFMSSLSTYPVVSALSTFVIIFTLSRIGGLWQRYDFVRDLTYFLSLQNRTQKMLFGLITTKDIVYFLVVTAMFTGFTLIKLQAGREARPWYIRTGRYLSVLAVTLLIGYISSRPRLTGYWDTTATQSNTIPQRMQDIIKASGDSTFTVTLYTNLLGDGLGHGLPEARNIDYMAAMWEPYVRFKPDMVFKYEYYYDTDAQGTDSALYKQYPGKTLQQIAASQTDAMDADLSDFKTPEQMHKTIDLRPEGYRLVMQVEYKGRKEFLRTFDDPIFWPDLTNVSAVFKRLLEPDKIPKVDFVSGELERSIYKPGEPDYSGHTSYKGSRGSMVNIGFTVDTVNLTRQEAPGDAAALVLADPKVMLDPTVQARLNAFVDRGGNMLVLGKNRKQYVINPFLRQFAVRLMNGQLVEPTYDETPDKVIPYATAASGSLYEGLSTLPERLSRGDTAKVLMPGATALTSARDSAFHKAPLLMTVPGRTWLKARDLVIDSTLPPFDVRAGDIKEPSFTTAVQLTRQVRGREQRIIICGDADFASNLRLGTSYGVLIPMYSWLTDNRFPVYMPSIEPKDVLLNITEKQASTFKIVAIWILPGLTLLMGTVLLIRRKKK
ncbi:MAG: Gldg family protein [Chitinophagaceae bacterium]|nr:Gldg family protein [Chitinophagaceae bacterium]